jgi:hypothetical protein
VVLELARGAYLDPDFDPAAASRRVLDGAREVAREARQRAEPEVERLGLPSREADLRLRRVQRGAEREELLFALEELEAWYRDLVVVGAGAERAAVHVDRLAELAEDATDERAAAAEAAAEAVRETWRLFEELNLQAGLAFEALFVRLRRELAGHAPQPV